MITPVSSYNICPSRKPLTLNVNFNGIHVNQHYYTDEEYRLAKKYLNTCNFESYLRDEIWKAKSGWDRFWGDYWEDTKYTFDEVKRLINDLKAEMEDKARQALELSKATTKKQAAIDKVKKEQEDAKCLLYGQQILNKRQQIHLDKLKSEEDKRTYIQKTLNDRVIMPLKAERDMKTGESSIDLNALNGIIFKNFDDKDYNETLKWLSEQSGCDIVSIDFGKLSLKDAFGQLLGTFKQAVGKNNRTFVRVDNLENHLVSGSIIQKKAVGKLKHLLQKCSEQYKSILLVNTKNENVIMQESGAPQRFGVKLDISQYKCDDVDVKFTPIYDGYEMHSLKSGDKPVQLYSGNFGYDNSILWVESETPEVVEDVLVNLDKVKSLGKFKEVTKVQHPIYFTDRTLTGFQKSSQKMWNGQPIYELDLKRLGL